MKKIIFKGLWEAKTSKNIKKTMKNQRKFNVLRRFGGRLNQLNSKKTNGKSMFLEGLGEA